MSKLRVYAFRGRIKCSICVRKMEGAARRGDTIYYRCNARTLVPGSATLGGIQQSCASSTTAAASEKRAAQAALVEVPKEGDLSRAELESYIDRLGDVAKALDRAQPEQPGELYASLRLALAYHHAEQIVDVEIDPLADRVDKYRVRGGTRTLTTRLRLAV